MPRLNYTADTHERSCCGGWFGCVLAYLREIDNAALPHPFFEYVFPKAFLFVDLFFDALVMHMLN
jgi:hypothetical protein